MLGSRASYSGEIDAQPNQFQGLHAFLGVQEFKDRNHCTLVDLSECACHGKRASDAVSNVPVSHLRTAAKENQEVGVGTRGLTVFLAHKMRSPSAQTRMDGL